MEERRMSTPPTFRVEVVVKVSPITVNVVLHKADAAAIATLTRTVEDTTDRLKGAVDANSP